ncbi:hypothetical protein ACTHGU_00920 [Chitinophagaceae bacterium MMS25-I14]
MPYQYVFDSWNDNMVMWAKSLGILIAMISLFTFIGKRTYVNLKGRTQNKLGDWIAAMSVIFFFSLIGLYQHYTKLGIKRRAAAVTGTLISKVWHTGKYSEWRFIYSYMVHGKQYKGEDVNSFYKREQDSAVAGNCYIVVYDSTHIGKSFMDLHEPVDCNQ